MMKHRKGIILAGGTGSRLWPITWTINKQLLPIYDKPLIYYPLSVLMLTGVRDVLLVVNEGDLPLYRRLFRDGDHLGLRISYIVQDKPRGLPDAFLLGREFIGSDPVTLILGDNIYYGAGFITFLRTALKQHKGATGYAYRVNNPSRFGVVVYDNDGKVQSLEEKPQHARSNWAVTGLYHFDGDVSEKTKTLKPSARGELEIVDLLRLYGEEDRLDIHRMPRGFSWLDTGTSEALIKAGLYVQTIEERQGIKIACLEEIAFNMGYIDRAQLERNAKELEKSAYAEYLFQILEEAS